MHGKVMNPSLLHLDKPARHVAVAYQVYDIRNDVVEGWDAVVKHRENDYEEYWNLEIVSHGSYMCIDMDRGNIPK